MTRLSHGIVSVVLFAAAVGGGFFVFRQLISGPKESTHTTIPNTPRDAVATYPIPQFIGFTTSYATTEVAIDSVINGQPVVGTMGTGATGDFYAQFQQGPYEVAGRDLMSAGSGQPFCSRPTGTVEFTCVPSEQRPTFLEPFAPLSSISTLVAFVPLAARPFAVASFARDEDVNGITRSRYDIEIDGNQFEKVDPIAFSEWASGLLIDVAGTVHLQLWIDANQMVWKSDVRTAGFADHRTLTVLRADQDSLVIPFRLD